VSLFTSKKSVLVSADRLFASSFCWYSLYFAGCDVAQCSSMRERVKSVKASGRIVGFRFACSEVQTLTPGHPSRMIYRTRKWICHSLASVACGIRLSRLSTCTRPSASFDARSRTAAAGALTIRMPLETWVVLRGGFKNTEKCGIGPWETS
jgi:hypothetical protein